MALAHDTTLSFRGIARALELVMTFRRVLPWTMSIAAAVGMAGCSAEAVSLDSRKTTLSNQFFENSVRRDATAAEASRVAKLTTSQCASFFLENTANKTYIVTARHCVEFAITSWCTRDGAIVDNNGVRGRCIRVVAADRNRDIAVIEANLPHPSTGDATLRLAAYVPSVNTKLVMTGYPGDDDPLTARRGRLTTTESCWVMGGAVQSPYASMDQNTLDMSAPHNCSTYGGNSGGPMYIQGTREAIGLPFTYVPDDYTRNSATDLTTAAFLALTADFVGAHRGELTAAGIVISESPVQSDATSEAGAPPPTTDSEGSTGQEGDTAPISDDSATDEYEAEDDSEEFEEEPTPKKKKKKRPAPMTMSAGGCAMSSSPMSSAAWPGAVIGLGAALASIRARRRRQ